MARRQRAALVARDLPAVPPHPLQPRVCRLTGGELHRSPRAAAIPGSRGGQLPDLVAEVAHLFLAVVAVGEQRALRQRLHPVLVPQALQEDGVDGALEVLDLEVTDADGSG